MFRINVAMLLSGSVVSVSVSQGPRMAAHSPSMRRRDPHACTNDTWTLAQTARARAHARLPACPVQLWHGRSVCAHLVQVPGIERALAGLYRLLELVVHAR